MRWAAEGRPLKMGGGVTTKMLLDCAPLQLNNRLDVLVQQAASWRQSIARQYLRT